MDLGSDLFPDLRPPEVIGAVHGLSHAGDLERGAVYTRPDIVTAILDLVGYVPTRPLHEQRILEPSFGAGDFLLPMIERLLVAFSAAGGQRRDALRLGPCIRAVEVHAATFDRTREQALEALVRQGISAAHAGQLLDQWLVRDDFLLAVLPAGFHYVVGNPPYVRQERIPSPLLAEYRRRYQTIYDRADLYVPFFERGLSFLAEGGRLGFICANRWLKNRYGRPLREFASRSYRLRYFMNLEGVAAFHSDVIAYPAITIFERATPGPTRVAVCDALLPGSMARVVSALQAHAVEDSGPVHEFARGPANGEPWLLDQPRQLAVLRKLESAFPPIESAGCKVGIGVATGADKVFIGRHADLPVEDGRKLPLAMAGDLRRGCVDWQGFGVINPFEEDGTLADLDRYPRFARYLLEHRPAIASRHCARRSDHGWYRTIDRITPSLRGRPKLLIPDIKGKPTVAIDEGRFYPHHNLYYVVSDSWDLAALATVLRSSFATLFVASYCVRMNGGFLRFQAQYLRKIRLPAWHDLTATQKTALLDASQSEDPADIDRAVAPIYRVTASDLREVQAITRQPCAGSPTSSWRWRAMVDCRRNPSWSEKAA